MENIDGWTKDEAGVIRDPEGHVWYGNQVETPKADIFDPMEGKEAVLRVVQVMKRPGETRPVEELGKGVMLEIEKQLFASGLTTNDNYPPQFQDQGKFFAVILVCRQTGTSRDIYSGMRDLTDTEKHVRGVKVRASKVGNINQLLGHGRSKKTTG